MKTPAWYEVLKPLARAEPSSLSPADTLLYVVDVPATSESGRLTLEVLAGRRARDGSWGRLFRLRLNRAEIPNLPDAADRKILSLLAGMEPPGDAASLVPARGQVPDELAGILLPLLCASGRCRPGHGAEPDAGEPLWLDSGRPWDLWIEVRERGVIRVTGYLRRGERERLALADALLVLPPGLVLRPDRVSRLAEGSSFAWVSLLRNCKGFGFNVPNGDMESLLERLFSLPDLPRLDLPKTVSIEEAHQVPRPRLRLYGNAGQDALNADLSFSYEQRMVPALSPRRAVYDPGKRRLLVRDLDAEQRAADRLLALGLHPVPGSSRQFPMRIASDKAPVVVRDLLGEGWSVEAQGKLYRPPVALRARVTTGMDWLELRVEADLDGVTVHLPEILGAIRRGESFLHLADGSQGVLPADWLKKLERLAGFGRLEGDHLRFSSAQATLLDAWLADLPEATWDEPFGHARDRLRGFEGIAPAAAPPGFVGELREYQRAGLGWLHFLRDFGFGGCLADDMGLGKTVQVLALLETRRAERETEGLPPSLVVVPRSLIFNWLAEAERFTPALRVLEHAGANRFREEDPFAGYDLVLTTYGTLRRDAAALRQIDLDYVILDEAQAIKNADSQTAQAARLLRGRHRLALTGTPVENHLGELWSLLEFLNPGLMGASALLRPHAAELRNPDPAARRLLARALKPFLLRRTKEQVAPELPARVEQTLVCELPPDQRRLYDETRLHYRLALGARIEEEGIERSRILVLEALLRLRQAACHPGLLDPERADEPCAKLGLLLPQLQEVVDEGHKVLVFSQFTSFLALLRRQLDREGLPYLYLDGQTRDRNEPVERFQSDPACQLFLISLKAGGLGLNLTAADYVYLLDPWWNPAIEAQAIDRAHRIGQTRPVFASRIVARDTVEEKILELQKSKRDLADAIIQADESLFAALSREDLELLLS